MKNGMNMAQEHWFDRLNKVAAHAAPRRGVLGAVVALTFGRPFAATDTAGKPGGMGGKKRKKGKKPSNPKPPEDPQAPDDCAATWPGKSKKQRKERNHCRFIRAQCDGDDPRDFCIEDGTKLNGEPTKVARCCTEQQPQCCGKRCCPPDARCCAGMCCGDPASPEVRCCNDRCFDTSINPNHCGACGNRCDAGQICVRGRCETSCGTGSCPQGLSCCASAENRCCQSFETCCPGGCKALLSDRDNCGACGHACPIGQSCIGGACGCREGFKYCGDECDVCDKCIREEWECCGLTSGCGPGHHCCGLGITKFCSAQPCP